MEPMPPMYFCVSVSARGSPAHSTTTAAPAKLARYTDQPR